MRRIQWSLAVAGLLMACASPGSTDQQPISRLATSPTPTPTQSPSSTPTAEPTATPTPKPSPTPSPQPTPVPTPDLVTGWAEEINQILELASDISADTRSISVEFARCDFSRMSLFNAQHFAGRQALKSWLSGSLDTPTPETGLMTALLLNVLELEIQADVPRSTAAMIETYERPASCTGGDSNSFDADAREAKAEFLSLYNPIAERYGLRIWSPDDF